MKKIAFFSAMLLASLAARSQRFADPQINILMEPPALQVGTNGLLKLDIANAGSDTIVKNSLEVTVGMSTNGEILGLAPGSHPAWTISNLTTGTNNTIKLQNTVNGLGADSLQVIILSVRGNTVGSASTITGGLIYIPANNPDLGGAPNAVQGNNLTGNDNSTTSLIVTAGPPLPIDLSSFTASMVNCQANLNWVVNTAKPYASFTLEQSVDGRNYEAVQTFAAGADPAYSHSVKQGTARSFYRLKLTDRAGNVSYSQTLALNADCMQAEISLSPNPTRGSVRISGLVKEGSVRVYNQAGAIVIQNPRSADPAVIDLSNLPAGLYRVSWESEAGVVTRSVTRL